MKNMNVKKAWAITLAIVIISSISGVLKTMSEMRVEAENYFYGEISITSDLDTKIGYSHNVVSIAKRYVGQNEWDKTEKAITNLQNAKTPKAKYKANADLDNNVLSLCKYLLDNITDMKDMDKKYIVQLSTDIESINNIIKYSSYNNLAVEYNEAINSIPVILFRGMPGINTLELYSE